MADADKKAERLKMQIQMRQSIADRKIEKSKTQSPEKQERVQEKYGYDYKSAESAGIEPDETGHWPSRNPDTGQILKGSRHPTFPLTKIGEKEAGYKMYKKDGKWYSKPK